MTAPEFDASGYPTEATEQALREWPADDPNGALDFLAAAWHWPDFGVSRILSTCEASVVHSVAGDRFLRLATGGWSGNESLLTAFQQNVAHLFTWQLSARGGLHIFRYPRDGA